MGSGRPRRPRATAILAEQASLHAAELTEAFRAALREDQPPRDRASAASQWLRVAAREATIEQRERALERERDEIDRLPRTELQRRLALVLARLEVAGRIDLNGFLPAPVVNGSAVEVRDD